MSNILNQHAPIRRYTVRNPNPPPVTEETLHLMKRRKMAKLINDFSYIELKVRTKRAIRNDMRQSVLHKVNNSSSSSLLQQPRPVIAPKRGKPIIPVSLTPDQLNTYFTSIGAETRDKVEAELSRSGREPMKPRLPRVNAGTLRIMPVTLDRLKKYFSRCLTKNLISRARPGGGGTYVPPIGFSQIAGKGRPAAPPNLA